jgi:hypothetical protein
MSLYKDASLAMIPSAYKDGKLYSIRPTDGSGDFTFSRGSNLAATRVDVNGLIEKGRENLITYSQDATQWSSQKSTRVSATEADPFGGNSAAEYAVSSITGGSYFYRTISPSLSSGQVFTGSIYVKNVDQRYVQLTFGTAAFGSSQYQNFDLQTGTKGTGTGMIDSTITSVGNDWYRISITKATISSGASGLVPCFVPSASATRLQAPSVVGRSFQAFGFQLEQGLVATDYIETGTSAAQSGILEDMPRLDYSGGASCPSLLLEPQRTNLIPFSEFFDPWNTDSGEVKTANTIESPEGVLNGNTLRQNNGASQLNVYKVNNVTSGADYVFSVWLKKKTTNQIQIYQYSIDAPVGFVSRASIDFDAGTITDVDGSGATIEPFDNGWFRCSIKCTMPSDRLSSGIYTATAGQADVYVYGAQVEQGSYPTSYIPTYGSSVTRGVDSCVATSVSDLIGQTQGTMFIDLTIDNLSNQTNNPIPFTLKGSGSTSSYIQVYTSGRIQAVHYGFGSLQANINLPTYGLTNGRHKFLFVYNENDFRFYVDGALAGSDTSGLVDAQSDVHLGYYNTSFNGTIENHQSILFPTALTDSECIALTTL